MPWLLLMPGHHTKFYTHLNSMRPRQDGRLFADDTFKRIFLNENIRISTKNSLKFVPRGLINNIPALVLIMAWRRPGDKPLSETTLVRSLTHICVTRPQWVNSLAPGKCSINFKSIIFKLTIQKSSLGTCCEIALRRRMPQNLTNEKSTLVQVMAWCCQITSHYLGQCWPWPMSPYGITEINILFHW